MEQTARVGLGPIDRVVLVVAWLVSCTAVYGLGFYTGSQTQDRLGDDEQRVVRLPISEEPPPVGQRAKTGDDLTFWGVLESGGRRSKPGEGIPTPRPQVTAPVEPVAAPEPPAARAVKRKPAVSPPSGKTARKPAAAARATRKSGTAAPAKPAPRAKTRPAASARKPAARPPGGAARPPAPPARGQAVAEPRAANPAAGGRPPRARAAIAHSAVSSG